MSRPDVSSTTPDSPPPLEPAVLAFEDYEEADYVGDIFSYVERPLSITVCVVVGEQPLPRVTVRVYHDRDYLEDEANLRAAWTAYTREMGMRISASLTSLVRDIMVETLLREGEAYDRASNAAQGAEARARAVNERSGAAGANHAGSAMNGDAVRDQTGDTTAGVEAGNHTGNATEGAGGRD